VGHVLTRGYNPHKMVFLAWWLSLHRSGGCPRSTSRSRRATLSFHGFVQVLGAGIITVPVSTIIFRFLPKTESSQSAGLYALMRNEGGSIGHSACQRDAPTQSATPPFDPDQIHQQLLSRHRPAASPFFSRLLRCWEERRLNICFGGNPVMAPGSINSELVSPPSALEIRCMAC
jgi:MFS transporter, DHA2 family, multidrug resistance protein